MAVVTKSIQSGGGGDYTDVASWEAGHVSFGTDIWKGEVDDNSEYNESVTLTGGTGTPSATSYLWLTGGASNRHSGVAGTGHPRMRSTSGHVLTIDSAYCRISWLEIQQDSGGSSDEGFRINDGADNVLIQYCVIWSDTDTSDQDGIYVGNYGIANLRVDNCIIYGFRRAQIHIQQYGTGSGQTITVDVDHCTLIYQSTTGDAEHGAIYIRSQNASDSITIDLYNTIGYMEYESWAAFADGDETRGGHEGTITWNGSHNLGGDQNGNNDIGATDNTTNWQNATSGDADTTQSTGSYVVFNEIDSPNFDFTLLDDAAGNLAAGNGTDRQGSEPDTRQDFSVDITGSSRPTTDVDIGAHQVSAAAAGANPPWTGATKLKRRLVRM